MSLMTPSAPISEPKLSTDGINLTILQPLETGNSNAYSGPPMRLHIIREDGRIFSTESAFKSWESSVNQACVYWQENPCSFLDEYNSSEYKYQEEPAAQIYEVSVRPSGATDKSPAAHSPTAKKSSRRNLKAMTTLIPYVQSVTGKRMVLEPGQPIQTVAMTMSNQYINPSESDLNSGTIVDIFLLLLEPPQRMSAATASMAGGYNRPTTVKDENQIVNLQVDPVSGNPADYSQYPNLGKQQQSDPDHHPGPPSSIIGQSNLKTVSQSTTVSVEGPGESNTPKKTKNSQTAASDLFELKALFHECLDFNNNGKLSKGELRFFLLALDLSDDEFYKVFKKFDAKNTGYVELDEVLFLVGAQFVAERERSESAAVSNDDPGNQTTTAAQNNAAFSILQQYHNNMNLDDSTEDKSIISRQPQDQKSKNYELARRILLDAASRELFGENTKAAMLKRKSRLDAANKLKVSAKNSYMNREDDNTTAIPNISDEKIVKLGLPGKSRPVLLHDFLVKEQNHNITERICTCWFIFESFVACVLYGLILINLLNIIFFHVAIYLIAIYIIGLFVCLAFYAAIVNQWVELVAFKNKIYGMESVLDRIDNACNRTELQYRWNIECYHMVTTGSGKNRSTKKVVTHRASKTGSIPSVDKSPRFIPDTRNRYTVVETDLEVDLDPKKTGRTSEYERNYNSWVENNKRDRQQDYDRKEDLGEVGESFVALWLGKDTQACFLSREVIYFLTLFGPIGIVLWRLWIDRQIMYQKVKFKREIAE